MEIPPNATERVVADIGPAPARDVLAQLLNGTHFNYVMVGSTTDPSTIQSIILTAKSNLPETASVAPYPRASIPVRGGGFPRLISRLQDSKALRSRLQPRKRHRMLMTPMTMPTPPTPTRPTIRRSPRRPTRRISSKPRKRPNSYCRNSNASSSNNSNSSNPHNPANLRKVSSQTNPPPKPPAAPTSQHLRLSPLA